MQVGNDCKQRAGRPDRWRSPDTRFATAVLTADVLAVFVTAAAISWFRARVVFAPSGTSGDVPGYILTVGAVLLANWAFGLYRCPPRGALLSWVGRVGAAVLASIGIAATCGVVVDRALMPRVSAALLVAIVPGVFVGVRQLARLSLPSTDSPAEDAADRAVPDAGPWFADVGWDTDDADEAAGPFTVRVRPSELVSHRLDQFAVLIVAFWAVPVAGITALIQRVRGRRMLQRTATNGAPVPTFDCPANSFAQRVGVDRIPVLWSVWCGRVSLLDPTLSETTLGVTRRVRRWPFLVSWLIAFRLFGLGHATGDTWGHILEATGDWSRTAWHPLLNSVIFVPSYRMFGSPILVTGTVIGGFWLALWFVTRAVERATGRNLTVVAVVMGFNPMLFNYMGLLAKDAFAASMIVICVSLLMRERVRQSRRGTTLVVAGLAAWTAALFNPAVITISLALLSYVAARALTTTSWRRGARLVVAGTLGVVAALSTVAVESTWEAQLDVPAAHKEESIMLFDIAGMSDDLGENLLPDGFLPPDRVDEFVNDCYDPKEWDSLAPFGGRCTWVLSTDEANRIWSAGELSTVWKQSIQDHPGTYVRTRLRHIQAFLTSPGKAPTYYWWEIGDFNGNWQLERNRVQDKYSAFYTATVDSPLFRPITWLTGSGVLLAAFAIRRRRGAPSSWGALPFVTCAAVVMFYSGWILIGVAYDFRYNYSAIWLFFLTLLMLISDIILSRSTRQGVERG